MTEVHRVGGVALRTRIQASEEGPGQPWGDVEAGSGTGKNCRQSCLLLLEPLAPASIVYADREAPSHSTSLPLAPPTGRANRDQLIQQEHSVQPCSLASQNTEKFWS